MATLRIFLRKADLEAISDALTYEAQGSDTPRVELISEAGVQRFGSDCQIILINQDESEKLTVTAEPQDVEVKVGTNG